ncbi:hypothetical protein HDV02_003630 [Globomyces sp. JEL0801]|nr:hypothetical protein HDV02_003630 [Globomyces sp. JEL0801]
MHLSPKHSPDRNEFRHSVSPLRNRSPDLKYKKITLIIRSNSDIPQNDPTANPGSNLFVTGLATRVRESELEELFGKYGKVTFMDFSNLRWKKFKSCTPTLSDLRRDPHSEDSRGFGFIKFSTDTDANAALALDDFDRGGPRYPDPYDRRYERHPRDRDFDRRPYDRYDRGYDRPPRERYDRYDRYDPRYDSRAPRDREYEREPIDRRGYEPYDRQRPPYDRERERRF